MTKRLSILLALITGLAMACGSDSGSNSENSHGDHSHGGSGEHDHYQPGMHRVTEEGLYDVYFYSDPAPPAVGLNRFTIYVRDLDGNPISDATVTVTPSMPSHGHGSDRDPVVHAQGGGVYEVENVSLQMMGIWEIAISVEGPSGLDHVRFTFDVL